MGAIDGSVATTTSPVILPTADLEILGIFAYGAPGYVSLPIDSTRNAIIGFSTPATSVAGQPQYGLQEVHFKVKGQSLTFTLTGLTNIIFYYGKGTLSQSPGGSKELENFQAIAVTNATTSATLTFNFPAKVN